MITGNRLRSGPKITKAAKTTKKTNLVFFVIFVIFVIFVPERGPSAADRTQEQQPARSQQRPPVFRAGAHYVAVDAYPESYGRIVEGLTREDVEVFEDGKPQTIDRFEFVRADDPDDTRPSRVSPRAALELAADPRNRVIIIVLDRGAFSRESWLHARDALRTYLRTDVQPRDLLGVITTDDEWTDLVLGRPLGDIEAELDHPEWLSARPQEVTSALMECGFPQLRGRIRADATYNLLEGLLRLFGQVREDRTSILFVTSGLSQVPPDRRGLPQPPSMPPQMGLVNGRIQPLRSATDMYDRFCKAEGQRLVDMDFSRRFDELTRIARQANVAFYPVAVFVPRQNPMPPMPMGRGGFGRMPARSFTRPSDSLVPLAKDTGGVAVRTPLDVTGALQRIVYDTGSHYLLGYYTTNTKWDGKLRSIKVRLKSTGETIRARRQYRAPTRDEIEGLSAEPARAVRVVPEAIVNALEPLSRVRTSTQFFAYPAIAAKSMTVTIEVPAPAVAAGRWADGANVDLIADDAEGKTVATARGRLAGNGRATMVVPLEGLQRPSTVMVRLRAEGDTVAERIDVVPNPSALVGDPLGFRSGPRGLNVPVASFVFARDERVRLDWPVFAPLDTVEARLLDRLGLPLKVRVAVKQQETTAGAQLSAEVGFAALGRGDYVLELTASSGATTETRVLALRLK
jgi:VWFA-related protein